MNFDSVRFNPKDVFRNFLERAEDDSWIAGYQWHQADSFSALRTKLGGPCAEGHSRTHKRGTDGQWWALEVEAHDGTRIGVDLEILISRPVLEEPEWITTRLNMSRSATPQKILEEWSAREAAFKAFGPDNEGILVSQIRRTAPNTLGIFRPEGEKSVQVRHQWGGRWVLSLAWRSLSLI